MLHVRLQVANGLAMTGPYFLVPILMEYLMENYGLRGGLMIYGGICLHVFLTGIVMKDIKIVGRATLTIFPLNRKMNHCSCGGKIPVILGDFHGQGSPPGAKMTIFQIHF